MAPALRRKPINNLEGRKRNMTTFSIGWQKILLLSAKSSKRNRPYSQNFAQNDGDSNRSKRKKTRMKLPVMKYQYS
jgi:hypothetical protein